MTPDSSFFALGADSLSLMSMTTELEQRQGVRVPVRDLFDSADTPRRLAERLVELRGDIPESPGDERDVRYVEAEHTGRLESATAQQAPSAVVSPAVEAPELHALFGQQLDLMEKLDNYVRILYGPVRAGDR
ncbi:acyl carrier protein [Streptomyces sp. NPDC091290]|uniref:acyl carrier protein n=1 Tax=Streptomyces sp. NPDC091290 TaxID=3365990 RepID=UPI003821304C